MFRISTLATGTVLAVVLSLAGAPPALGAADEEDPLAGTSVDDGTGDGGPGGTPDGESGDDPGAGGKSGDDAEDDNAGPGAGSTDGPVDPGALHARTLGLQLLEATDEPGTFDDLALNPATCTDGDVLTLDQDITGGRLTINCDLTLDLAGFTLDTNGVLVSPANTLTIDDTGEDGELIAVAADRYHAGVQIAAAQLVIKAGTITATGGEWGAGIGGGYDDHDVDVRAGGTVTVHDGTITATGGQDGAGIGGGNSGDGGTTTIKGGTITANGGMRGAGIGGGISHGGTTTIEGGTITANGGMFGAGIGGGNSGDGGTTDIRGGTITATGGWEGAGIGGGSGGGHGGTGTTGGTITITGGTTTANGGMYSAGIGGGNRGDGGKVKIGPSATVTATGGFNAVGEGINSGDFGSLELAGTLHVPTGAFIISDSNPAGAEVVITSTGKLLGTVADPTTGASVTSGGQIANGGVIALTASLVNVTVTGHNFLVSFDTQGGTNPAAVRVFAPDFATSYRTLPASPAGAAWATAPDGTGTGFTATTPLTSDSALLPKPVTIYATNPFLAFAYATANCTDGATIALTENSSGGRLTIGCDLTLDLAGFTLNTAGVLVTPANKLTIDDTGGEGKLIAAAASFAGIQTTGAELVIKAGTINAAGGFGHAGIGGPSGAGGGTITIEDGTITATGGGSGAGIGGGSRAGGGTITIEDGTITATGGGGDFNAGAGAGIGGGGGNEGAGGGAGTVLIKGAIVTAQGGSSSVGIGGAGIGTGWGGSGGTVTIDGGTVIARGSDDGPGIGTAAGILSTELAAITINAGDVTATGGVQAAGIGGSIYAHASTPLTIGEHAVVTASGGTTAIGNGSGAFGPLEVAGTLHVPSGVFIIPNANPTAPEVVITSTGKLLGTVDDPTTGATISGAGQIANGGVIALDATLVGVTVTDNNYAVGFERQDAATETVRVFGPRFDGSYRSVPAAGTHRGWNTSADGSGAWFTPTTALAGDLTVHETTRVGVALTPAASITDVDAPVTFTATVTDLETGAVIDDAPVTLVSSITSDEITGLQVTATELGDRTITATVTGTTATGTATLTVRVPAPIGCNLGAPGMIVAPWSAQTVYQAGQLAALDGVVYKASWYAHGDMPGASPWGPWEFHTVCGVSPDAVQAWSKTTVYDTGDRVTHNGKTWRAKWWTRNQAPGDPWGPWETVG